MGATTDQIDAMDRGDLTSFEPAWRAAFQAAEVSTTDRGKIPADIYSELKSHWNAGQIIEIIAVIGLFNYFNRFAIGLDIPPTK
jgi:alkylhydroperoxidase family enzyme